MKYFVKKKKIHACMGVDVRYSRVRAKVYLRRKRVLEESLKTGTEF